MKPEMKPIHLGRRGFATGIVGVAVRATAAAGAIACATTALKTTASRLVTSVGITLLVAVSLAAGSARAVQDGLIAYTQNCDGQYVTLTVTATGEQPYETMTFSLYLAGPPGYLVANPQQIESDANAVATATFSGVPSAGATVYLLVHSPSVGFLYTHDFALSDCSPQTQLSALVAEVQGLDATAGITNSLDAKLSHIQDALSAAKNNSLGVACNSLDAFLNEVAAQAQSQVITAVQAAALTNAAMSIKRALGC